MNRSCPPPEANSATEGDSFLWAIIQVRPMNDSTGKLCVDKLHKEKVTAIRSVSARQSADSWQSGCDPRSESVPHYFFSNP